MVLKSATPKVTTLREAMSLLRQHNVVITSDHWTGEYGVHIKGLANHLYHTTDLQDAVDTGLMIAASHELNRIPVGF